MSMIDVSCMSGAAVVTLNRPDKCNALDGTIIMQLQQALSQLSVDDTVRVLLLQGSGAHFCAGADIDWLQKMAAASPAENEADAIQLAELIYQLSVFPKPTIALTHGAAMGGGIGLLAACDIVLAAQNASFAFSEVKIGLIPAIISPYIVAAIGAQHARYYFLTGSRFDAEEAKRLGLVHQITTNDSLQEQGQALAKMLLANSPSALAAVKQLLRTVGQEQISHQQTSRLAKQLAALCQSPEGHEGLQAFLEKRKPIWK